MHQARPEKSSQNLVDAFNGPETVTPRSQTENSDVQKLTKLSQKLSDLGIEECKHRKYVEKLEERIKNGEMIYGAHLREIWERQKAADRREQAIRHDQSKLQGYLTLLDQNQRQVTDIREELANIATDLRHSGTTSS